MNESNVQIRQKEIEDLTVREVDMIYSLARVGEWNDQEIGRRYGISTPDVREVVDNYEELRKTAKNVPIVTAKDAHRAGRNARYGSNAERQAAYRARLKEKRDAEMQQTTPVTDTATPTEEDLSLQPSEIVEPSCSENNSPYISEVTSNGDPHPVSEEALSALRSNPEEDRNALQE